MPATAENIRAGMVGHFDISLDTESILRELDGRLALVWDITGRPDGDENKGKTMVMLSYIAFDCARRTTATVVTLRSDINGQMLGSERRVSLNVEWDPVVPGTIAGMEFDLACRQPAAPPPKSTHSHHAKRGPTVDDGTPGEEDQPGDEGETGNSAQASLAKVKTKTRPAAADDQPAHARKVPSSDDESDDKETGEAKARPWVDPFVQ
jgi:hypothetical protein